MPALVSADPTALDLVHRGTLDLGDQLRVLAGEVTAALDAARRSTERLGDLGDPGLLLIDLGLRSISLAAFVGQLAQGLQAADVGALQPLGRATWRALTGQDLPPFSSGAFGPSLLWPLVDGAGDRSDAAWRAITGQDLPPSSGGPLDLSWLPPVLNLGQLAFDNRRLWSTLFKPYAISRATGFGLGDLGLDMAWTRWAQRTSRLMEIPYGPQALQGVSALAVVHDLATEVRRFAHHASAADKIDGGLQLGLDASILAYRLAPGPWSGLAVGATGLAWAGFKVGRLAWDHRAGIEAGGRAAARGAVAVGRALKAGLEGVVGSAEHTGEDVIDLVRRLPDLTRLMPPGGGTWSAPGRSLVAAVASTTSEVEHAVAEAPGNLLHHVASWFS